MEKIKIALVGTGSICRSAHMPAYKKRDDVEIIACADIDFGKAQKFAEDYGIPAVYASVEELLANCKPDYVDVCTWPAAHAPVAIAAANAGCHVMCEKPVCHNLDDALQNLHPQFVRNIQPMTGIFHNLLLIDLFFLYGRVWGVCIG